MLPFPKFPQPVIQAPLSGGPSTTDLTAAVIEAGGFGFLAAGYKTEAAVRADVQSVRARSAREFGLNVFVPASGEVDHVAVARYVERLQPEAARYNVELGAAHRDSDAYEAKLALAVSERLTVVSFTFGCPTPEVIARLHAHDIAAWVTVTEPAEALFAERAGADALVLQGVEAGGHRGTFVDQDGLGELSTLVLLRLCARQVSLPLVAAGGIADGAGLAAVLAAGARAGQIGTAFMLCPEAGTSAPHRAALKQAGATALTRAFTGRRARGIVNAFMIRHEAVAPSAYPEVHYVTAPLRAAARAAGDADGFHLWAGEAHELAEAAPARELVERWSAEAQAALARATAERFG
jgi:nitronate monooxygenase